MYTGCQCQSLDYLLSNLSWKLTKIDPSLLWNTRQKLALLILLVPPPRRGVTASFQLVVGWYSGEDVGIAKLMHTAVEHVRHVHGPSCSSILRDDLNVIWMQRLPPSQESMVAGLLLLQWQYSCFYCSPTVTLKTAENVFLFIKN